MAVEYDEAAAEDGSAISKEASMGAILEDPAFAGRAPVHSARPDSASDRAAAPLRKVG